MKNPIAKSLVKVNPCFQEIAIAKDEEELKVAVEKFNSLAASGNGKRILILKGIQKIVKDNLIGRKKQVNLICNEFKKYNQLIGVESGIYGQGSVHPLDSSYAQGVRSVMIAEYKASTPTEKMLVDLAVNAYFRALRFSKIQTIILQKKDGSVSFNQELINLITSLGKQISAANNQFLTAITYIKEFRQPGIKIKVQANQAFVGQNQQFNKNV